MTRPEAPPVARARLHLALRLTRHFASIFYALLALLLALLSVVPPLLALHLSHTTELQVLFVTPLIALPLLAATIWRRRAVIRRLSAVIIALDDGGLLERPEEGLTRLAALENDSAPASLPQLSDRLKSLSDSVATPPSAVTPLLSVVRAPLQAAFSSLANHPVVQLHGLLSRLFQTLGIISVLHPLLTTVMGGVAWLLSKPKESVAINVLGAVSGAGSQIGTWAVRKRVLRLVSDAVEQLVDEEVERLVGEGVGDGLMDGISKIGGDSVDMAQFNLLPRP